MTYVPIPDGQIVPGLKMDDVWGDLGDNHDQIYLYCAPWIVSAMGFANSANGDAEIVYNGSTGSKDFLKFRIFGHRDDDIVGAGFIRFYFLARRTSGTATIQIHVDGTVPFTQTINITSATLAWYQVTVQTTGTGYSAAGKDVTISMNVTFGGANEIALLSVTAFDYQASAGSIPNGVLPSGFTEWHPIDSAANEPINSERLSRLIRGPYQIAKDRPTTLFSLIDNINERTNAITTTSATYEQLYVGGFITDIKKRAYRLVLFVSGAVGANVPRVRVKFGQNPPVVLTAAASAGEFLTTTFTVGGTANEPMCNFTIEMENSGGGGGEVVIHTIQIAREPS